MFATRFRQRAIAECALILVLVALLVVGVPSPGGSLAAFNATTSSQNNLIVSTTQTIGNAGQSCQTNTNAAATAYLSNHNLIMPIAKLDTSARPHNISLGAAPTVTNYSANLTANLTSAAKISGAGNSGNMVRTDTSANTLAGTLANLTPVGHNLLL